MSEEEKQPDNTPKIRANGKDEIYHRWLDDVIAYEKENYLKQRRKELKIGEDEDFDKSSLWGIALSGGGIRSSTFALGVIQALTKVNIFKRFDYMSTVSGGGFIGSCVTSLLTDWENRKTHIDPEKSEYTSPLAYIDGKIGNTTQGDFNNQSAENNNIGTIDYTTADKTDISSRHQLHHLRENSSYLVQNHRFISRDMQRFIGALGFGFVYNLVLFFLIFVGVTASIHTLITPFIVDEQSKAINCWKPLGKDTSLPHFEKFGMKTETISKSDSIKDFSAGIKYWCDSVVAKNCSDLFKISSSKLAIEDNYFFQAAVLGSGYSVLVFIVVWVVKRRIVYSVLAKWYKDVAKDLKGDLNDRVRAGDSLADYYEKRFLKIFNWVSFGVVVTVTWLLAYFQYYAQTEVSLIMLPAAFATGAYCTFFIAALIFDTKVSENSRLWRSLMGGVKGASFYGLILSFAIPLSIILLLSLSHFPSLPWLNIAEFVSATLLYQAQNSTPAGITNKFLSRIYKPLLNILVISLLAFSIAPISRILYLHVYRWEWLYYEYASIPVVLLSFTLVCLLTYLIDSNDISAYFFYRDRLTEAFLRTNARVNRDDNAHFAQGRPLLTVRNDETLLLSELGDAVVNRPGYTPEHAKKREPNTPCHNQTVGQEAKKRYIAPYQILLAALNMRGTDELTRRSLYTDHFIFSKFWIGSQTTGYVKTTDYRKGKSRLATAMTVSGAAFSSAVGFHTFLAQSFLATIFNVRLGLWAENPWWYRSRRSKITRFPIWIFYLLREMFGRTNGKTRFVALSDGGHTGDNIGLLPLLQRRCKVIAVVDAEEDANLEFASLNTAIRLALVEEDIDIKIDLTNIILPQQEETECQKDKKRKKDKKYKKDKKGSNDNKLQQATSNKNGNNSNEIPLRRCSVALGQITYPERKDENFKITHTAENGILIYIKSSCSEPEGQFLQELTNKYKIDDNLQEFLKKEIEECWTGIKSKQFEHDIPAHVTNYNRSHSTFPHQSTLDQFFDDEQFEAYRALGNHVAGQAIEVLKCLSIAK